MTETMDTDAPEMTVKMDQGDEAVSKAAPVIENGHDGHNDAGTSGIEVKIENGSSEPPISESHPPSSTPPASAVTSTTTPTKTESTGTVAVDGEVSPSSLRRSTRASALKAQEKLKVKDGMDVYAPNGLTHHHHNHHESSGLDALHDSIHQNGDNPSAATNKDEPASKKPKLNHGLDLDQYDCKFGVRMDKDDVYMLTDESEISSLNSAEVSGLKKNYEEFKSAAITEEQQFERDLLVRELETSLRFEENKLITLKKVVQNQKEAEVEQAKRAKHLSEIAERQRQATQAYKPTVAPNPAKVNGAKSNKGKTNARDNPLNHLDPAQQQLIFQKLLSNPQFASQAQQLLPKHFQQMLATHQSNLGKSSSVGSNLTNLAAAVQQQAQVKKEPPVPTITPAQRAAEARRKLRQQLDQQLLSQPTPKGLPTEMNFVPSATNDFCYLLGLDLTVQRVLKDKNVFKKYEEQPYVCEECHTDFTPSWKAIGASENDLHLYCEACVKTAQKRQMKSNHAATYKKLFAKIAEQEKELEKQIAAGKFDDPPAPPPVAAPPSKPSTPVTNMKASSSTMPTSASAGNVTMANMAYIMAQAQAQQQQQQAAKAKAAAAAAAEAVRAQQPSTSAQASRSQTSARGTKRPATSTPQASSSSNQSHQQQALINMIRSNPLIMAQMMGGMGGGNQAAQMAALMQIMNSQAGGGSGSGRGNGGSNVNSNQLGMAALIQAAMQQQVQQQMQASGNGGNNSSNNVQQMMQQLAMFQNPNMFAMMNPTMLQSMQRMAAANNKSKK
uniref:P66_CC domain-containing protein n=1 Tax=Panagrellus redivivus TaxID=6233 RepID=A0A7E4V7U8_PANRE